MLKLFAFIAAAAALTACGGQPINTPSGQPETLVGDVDPACMRAQVVNHVVNQGYQVLNSTETLIVAQRRAPSFGAQLFFGTGWGPAMERLQITMIATQPRTMRLIVHGAMVSNAGTGLERSTPVAGRGNDQASVSQGLQDLAVACQPPGTRRIGAEPAKTGAN